MQVHTELIHGNNLQRLRARNGGQCFFCEFVVLNPGTACVHMSFDPEPGPVVQFLAYYFADCLWLKTQRIAGQVYGRSSIYSWQMKFVPEPAQWVGSVQFTRESQSFFI